MIFNNLLSRGSLGLSSYTEVPPDFVGQTLNSAACSLFQHKFRSDLLCVSVLLKMQRVTPPLQSRKQGRLWGCFEGDFLSAKGACFW